MCRVLASISNFDISLYSPGGCRFAVSFYALVTDAVTTSQFSIILLAPIHSLPHMADDAFDTFAAFESVFDEKPACQVKKLQSWSDKVCNATSGAQVRADLRFKCSCKAACCRTKFVTSYVDEEDCFTALLQLRTERTKGQSSDEAIWLFDHLYNSRTRAAGQVYVLFRLDGVSVCEQYFTVALGFTFPNRRIQRYVRLIKVILL